MSTTASVPATIPWVNSAGHFPWARFPEVKLLIYFAGTSRATDEQLLASRNWNAFGVTADYLYGVVTKRLPWFPTLYREATGKVLTPERVRDRLFNMYWSRALGPMLGERAVSGEHPSNSPTLKPYVSMGRALWRWLVKDPARTLDYAVARALFDAPPLTFTDTLARLDAAETPQPAEAAGQAGAPAPGGRV